MDDTGTTTRNTQDCVDGLVVRMWLLRCASSLSSICSPHPWQREAAAVSRFWHFGHHAFAFVAVASDSPAQVVCTLVCDTRPIASGTLAQPHLSPAPYVNPQRQARRPRLVLPRRRFLPCGLGRGRHVALEAHRRADGAWGQRAAFIVNLATLAFRIDGDPSLRWTSRCHTREPISQHATSRSRPPPSLQPLSRSCHAHPPLIVHSERGLRRRPSVVDISWATRTHAVA